LASRHVASPVGAEPFTTLRAPGTYLLLLNLDRATRLQVGRLGLLDLPPGWYVYIGSALGGLGPRLRRHLSREKRPHWHIDTLRAAATLTAVAARIGPERVECAVAALVAARPGATLPVRRFGSTDCRCRAHLVHFPTPPDLHLDPSWRVWSPGDRAQGMGFGSDGTSGVPSAGTAS
jgi:Uri superfamily endonuclease